MPPLSPPQPGRLPLGEPIDDVAQHAEQQGLEYPNRRREYGHGGDEAARAPRPDPQEREEAVRQRRRRRIRVGRDEFFEILEQDSWAPAAAAILESYRPPKQIALQDERRPHRGWQSAAAGVHSAPPPANRFSGG